MKVLNLVNQEKSDIKYQIQRFPDGQQQVVIDLNFIIGYKVLTVDSEINHPLSKIGPRWKIPIEIKARLNNFLDLELITCAVASLRELGVEEIHLYTPYIMGARSDRKFEEGGNNYIKDVLAPAINSLNFKTVTCIDPHSDVLEACIKGFRKQSTDFLIRWGIAQTWKGETKDMQSIINNCILVSPDAGASKKIYKLTEQIGYKGDIITCSKDRDKEGKLTKTIVPLTQDDGSGYTMEYKDNCNEKDFIIIDDICDGGATFINIAKSIKEQISDYKGKIYLIVTHGIFSKGFEELNKYFDGIYCTNSYKDIGDYNGNDLIKTNTKPLNVF